MSAWTELSHGVMRYTASIVERGSRFLWMSSTTADINKIIFCYGTYAVFIEINTHTNPAPMLWRCLPSSKWLFSDWQTSFLLMYVWPCIIYENDERYQLDATIVIYYHKYLYMLRASTCPSSGVQVVCCCIWCSAPGVVAVVLRRQCLVLCTQCTRLNTSSLGPQPQHLVLNTICSNIQPVLLKMGI